MSEAMPWIVAIVAGLGSGVLGSWLGARAQRRIFVEQAALSRAEALWAYEMALRDESDHLMEHDLTGRQSARRAGPSVLDARVAAYRYLHTLPHELEKDLRDPMPADTHSSFEAGDHLGWLANRLMEVLRTEHAPTALRLRSVVFRQLGRSAGLDRAARDA